MSELVFEPTVKQIEFMRCHARHVAYGGARGGGKSWVVRVKAVLLGNRYEGIRMLLIRRTLSELRNNHINPLTTMLKGIARYNKTEKTFYFHNGSTLQLGYCDNDNDLMQYQGGEWDIVFLEEATNLQEDWIKKLLVCVRGANGFPKRVYWTMNPGGPSHQYIKRLFIDKRYEEGENPDDYAFVQALVTDNKALMAAQPEYLQMLNALPPKLRAAWRDGSWDIYEGQFFEDFVNRPQHWQDRRWTHVIEPFMPSKHWEYYRSFDWGYRRPFSCGYYAVNPDGVVFRIAEYYGVQHSGNQTLANEGLKWAPAQVFAELSRFEHEHPYLAGKQIHGVADPAIWDAESGESIAEVAMKHGIYFDPGDHARVPGWMMCHYYLQFDEDGYPRFYVFNTCSDFIRTIPTLQYDEHKAEDLDSTGEDHAADEWRYFCMSRPVKPRMVKEMYRPAWGSDPLEQMDEDKPVMLMPGQQWQPTVEAEQAHTLRRV